MFSWNYCRQVNRNDKNSWVQMTLEEHHRNSQFESPLFEVCELWNGKINNRWDRRRHFSSVQPYRNPLFAIVFSSTKKQHFISRFSLHFRDPCILTLQCFFFLKFHHLRHHMERLISNTRVVSRYRVKWRVIFPNIHLDPVDQSIDSAFQRIIQ